MTLAGSSELDLPAAHDEVLLDDNGNLRQGQVQRLLKSRANRDVYLNE